MGGRGRRDRLLRAGGTLLSQRARTAIVFGTNLAVGVGVLAWVWHRWGPTAWHVLAAPDPRWLLATLAVAVATLGCFAVRWRILLRAMGTTAPLGTLAAIRCAGQSLSTLVPSGKLVGEPLRVVLAARAGVPAPRAIASVAVDRTLELAGSAPFACVYTGVLVAAGVHEAQRAFASVVVGTLALAGGVALAVRRLRLGRGLVTAFARSARLDRLRLVRDRLHVVDDAETALGAVVADRRRVAASVALGLATNVLNFLEYQVLLAAFGLPATPFPVVAAIVAAEVSRSVPVPAAIGALEGAQAWMFSLLGYGPDVGLAVGLAVRLRELAWLLPGLVVLVRGGRRPLDDATPAPAASAAAAAADGPGVERRLDRL